MAGVSRTVFGSCVVIMLSMAFMQTAAVTCNQLIRMPGGLITSDGHLRCLIAYRGGARSGASHTTCNAATGQWEVTQGGCIYVPSCWKKRGLRDGYITSYGQLFCQHGYTGGARPGKTHTTCNAITNQWEISQGGCAEGICPLDAVYQYAHTQSRLGPSNLNVLSFFCLYGSSHHYRHSQRSFSTAQISTATCNNETLEWESKCLKYCPPVNISYGNISADGTVTCYHDSTVRLTATCRKGRYHEPNRGWQLQGACPSACAPRHFGHVTIDIEGKIQCHYGNNHGVTSKISCTATGWKIIVDGCHACNPRVPDGRMVYQSGSYRLKCSHPAYKAQQRDPATQGMPTCHSNGSWTNLPQCVPKCTTSIKGGKVSVVGSVSCYFGYYSSPAPSGAQPRCLSTGQWRGIDSCKKCSSSIPHGRVSERDGSVRCTAGYFSFPPPSGRQPRCLLTGQWAGIDSCKSLLPVTVQLRAHLSVYAFQVRRLPEQVTFSEARTRCHGHIPGWEHFADVRFQVQHLVDKIGYQHNLTTVNVFFHELVNGTRVPYTMVGLVNQNASTLHRYRTPDGERAFPACVIIYQS